MVTPPTTKAIRFNLLNFKAVPMRPSFTIWITFFLCFSGWFGIAPLTEFAPVKDHARLFYGWLCDKIAPRISYSILFLISPIPLMFIGLSDSHESFLPFRLAIGVIAISFLLIQYRASAAFACNAAGKVKCDSVQYGAINNNGSYNLTCKLRYNTDESGN